LKKYPTLFDQYFATMGAGGAAAAGAGDMANVSQLFHPDARFSAANSL
jgi:hypothetical protein